MSSSIDWFICPKCGDDTAHREQDNRTCEVYYGCSQCDWHGETIIDDEAESEVNMDLCEKIIAHESGELSTIETVKLFADLIRTKLAWTLQGSYGRQAAAFIRAGVISSDTGTINYERLDELMENEDASS